MNKSTRLIITAAAMAGLYAGSLAVRAHAEDQAGTPATKDTSKDKSSCSGKDGCKGKDSCKSKDGCKGTASCKGHNDCKGKGGCKSGDNGCLMCLFTYCVSKLSSVCSVNASTSILVLRIMEPMIRLELMTSSLPRTRSTN